VQQEAAQAGETCIETQIAHFRDKAIAWHKRLKEIDDGLTLADIDIAGWRADAKGLAYLKHYLRALETARRELLRDVSRRST
jgi:hypothetical protein